MGAELIRADLCGVDLTEEHPDQAKLNQANLAYVDMIQVAYPMLI